MGIRRNSSASYLIPDLYVATVLIMTSTLILLRHGESQWNLENRFTGWTDVGLTDRGVAEARAAGVALIEAGLLPDVAHTSVLVRSILTLQEVLAVMERLWIPVRRSWRLNERHYGALQGLNKAETAAEHGEEQVQVWRRSYDVRPPALSISDDRHPGHDPRYSALPSDVLPACESLNDVVIRMLPYWHVSTTINTTSGFVAGSGTAHPEPRTATASRQSGSLIVGWNRGCILRVAIDPRRR